MDKTTEWRGYIILAPQRFISHLMLGLHEHSLTQLIGVVSSLWDRLLSDLLIMQGQIHTLDRYTENSLLMPGRTTDPIIGTRSAYSMMDNVYVQGYNFWISFSA